MVNRRASGMKGESEAVDFLKKKGYRILGQNFRFERGEIDIVAEDNGMLVFVEVKARRSNIFGDPEDAVTASIVNQIRKVGQGYLFQHDLGDRECRFDIVAIEYTNNIPVIRHIEDAF